MCPRLIEIGSKTAEKNSAQTNKQTNKQTDRQTDTMKIMVTWPWNRNDAPGTAVLLRAILARDTSVSRLAYIVLGRVSRTITGRKCDPYLSCIYRPGWSRSAGHRPVYYRRK